MKNIFLLLTIFSFPMVLNASVLDIKVTPATNDIIAGMPLIFNVGIKNTSSIPIEVPIIGGERITIGGLCSRNLIKFNGEKPSTREFLPNVALASSDRSLHSLQTEFLQPGESREIIFNYGEAIVPMEYEFFIECRFYDDPKDYEKHNLHLDHKIISGVYSSNKLKLEVNSPTGVDKEIHDKYLKGKPLSILWGKSKEIQKILKEYPQSKYSPWLSCSSPVSKAEYYKDRDPKQHIEIHLKHKNWLRNDVSAQKRIKEKRESVATYIKLAELHPDHICSLTFYLTAVDTAITTGDFKTACELTNKILDLKPRNNIDTQIQQKACEYQNVLKSHNLCR